MEEYKLNEDQLLRARILKIEYRQQLISIKVKRVLLIACISIGISLAAILLLLILILQ